MDTRGSKLLLCLFIAFASNNLVLSFGQNVSGDSIFLCKDKCCSGVLGQSTTLRNYRSNDPQKPSFDSGVQLDIYGESKNFYLARLKSPDREVTGFVGKLFARKLTGSYLGTIPIEVANLKKECNQMWQNIFPESPPNLASQNVSRNRLESDNKVLEDRSLSCTSPKGKNSSWIIQHVFGLTSVQQPKCALEEKQNPTLVMPSQKKVLPLEPRTIVAEKQNDSSEKIPDSRGFAESDVSQPSEKTQTAQEPSEIEATSAAGVPNNESKAVVEEGTLTGNREKSDVIPNPILEERPTQQKIIEKPEVSTESVLLVNSSTPVPFEEATTMVYEVLSDEIPGENIIRENERIPEIPSTEIPSSEPQTPEESQENTPFTEYVMLIKSVMPQSLENILMLFEKQGIPSHSVVLTCICGSLGLLLILFMSCIAQSSKEAVLTDYIARLEQHLFALKREREVLLDEKNANHLWNSTENTEANHCGSHEELNEEISQLKSENESLQSALDALKKVHSELESDVQSNNQADEMIALVAEKDSSIAELERNNGQLLEEVQIWNERVQELRSHLETRTADLQAKTKELETRVSEVKKLKEELEKQRSRSASFKGENHNSSATSSEGDQPNEEDFGDEIQRLTEELRSSKTQNETLLQEKEQILRSKEDMEQRLNVLSKYFEDREFQLQKDVMRHESLWQKNENDALGAIKQLEFFKDHNDNLQAQLDKYKEDHRNLERQFKRQLMEQEKKSHENWMAFKNAEKKNEDSQSELLALRQQLILMQKERELVSSLPLERPRPPPPLPLPKKLASLGYQPPFLPPLPVPSAGKRNGRKSDGR